MAATKELHLKNKIEKAAASHSYIHVIKKDGKFHTTSIKLSGCLRMFNKDPDFLYIYSVRHAGHLPDIVDYFVENGFADDDKLTEYLNQHYSAYNFEENRLRIQEEIEEIPKAEKVEIPDVSFTDMKQMKKSLVGVRHIFAKAVKGDSSSPPTPTTPVTPKGKGLKLDTRSRLETLEEGRALDVTGYNVVKGTGIKTIKRTTTGKTLKRPLSSTGDLSKIYFDFSKAGNDVAIAALIHLGFSSENARIAVEAAQVNRSCDISTIVLN